MAAPSLGAETEALLWENSRSYRLTRLNLSFDGHPVDFGLYAHMVGIIDDNHPKLCCIKGSQLGLTAGCVMKCWDRQVHDHVKGSLYLFPLQDDVSDFSRTRFARMLQDNPVMSDTVKSTDSTTVRQIGGGFVYFRHAGAQGSSGSKSKLKSMPINDIYMDEYDDMDASRIDVALHRLDGVPDGQWRLHEFGTPEIPAAGIDARYQESDQRVWEIQCAACGAWQSLPLFFPENLALPSGKDAYFECHSCKKALKKAGHRWTALFPDRDETHGYWISQLNSPVKSVKRIGAEWLEANEKGGSKLAEFHRHVLGQPYAELDQILTPEMVRSRCTVDPMKDRSPGPCALGADVGAHTIHVQIREKTGDRMSRVVFHGILASFNELHDVATKFHVQVGIIDEMAETRRVRDFIDKHPGFYGAWYITNQKEYIKWDLRGQKVKLSRSTSLDASHQEILDERVTFPRITEHFENQVIPQMCNLARTIRIDETTGQPRVVWVVKGSKRDHYRHAHNYACAATEDVSLFSAITKAKREARMKSRRESRRRNINARGFMAR